MRAEADGPGPAWLEGVETTPPGSVLSTGQTIELFGEAMDRGGLLVLAFQNEAEQFQQLRDPVRAYWHV